MKKESLHSRLERMEVARLKLLAELEREDEITLHKRPTQREWSIAQVFYHLNFSESRSVSYISKKMLGGNNLPKTGFRAAVRSFLLSGVLRSGYKLKAPEILGDVPEEVNYRQIVGIWNETRNKLFQLIDTLPEGLIEREIYKHPIAGRLNLNHMLLFLEDHFNHHLNQINRLRKK